MTGAIPSSLAHLTEVERLRLQNLSLTACIEIASEELELLRKEYDALKRERDEAQRTFGHLAKFFYARSKRMEK